MLKIEIDTDNAAFDYPDGNNEIKRIFKNIIKQMENDKNSSFIFDSNGNVVGKWEFNSERLNQELIFRERLGLNNCPKE